MKKRLLSTFLALVMVLTLLPTTALADTDYATTYDELLEQLHSSDPNYSTISLRPDASFGWPTEETTLPLNKQTGLEGDWIIPANVTVVCSSTFSGTYDDGSSVTSSLAVNGTFTANAGVSHMDITVNAGGRLNVENINNSAVTMENDSTLAGKTSSGIVWVNDGSVLTLKETTDVTAQNIRLEGGTLVGNNATLTTCGVTVQASNNAASGTIEGTLTLSGENYPGITINASNDYTRNATLTIAAGSTVTVADTGSVSVLGAGSGATAQLNVSGTLNVRHKSTGGVTVNEFGSIHVAAGGVLNLYAPTTVNGQNISDSQTSVADPCITGDGTVNAYYDPDPSNPFFKEVRIYNEAITLDTDSQAATKPHIGAGVTVNYLQNPDGGGGAATTPATLYVGGVPLTINGTATGNSYANATYAADTNTLTLSGANIPQFYTIPGPLSLDGDGSAGIRAGIYYSGSEPLNMELTPDTANTITLSPSYDQTDEHYIHAVGIYADGDVKIKTTSAGAQMIFQSGTLTADNTFVDAKADACTVKAEAIYVLGDLILQEYVRLSENCASFSVPDGGTYQSATNAASATVYVQDNLETRSNDGWGPEVACRRIITGAYLSIGEHGSVTADAAEVGTRLELHDGTATIRRLTGATVSVFGGSSANSGTLTVNDVNVETLIVNGTNAKLIARPAENDPTAKGMVAVTDRVVFRKGTVCISPSGNDGLYSPNEPDNAGIIYPTGCEIYETADVTIDMTGGPAAASGISIGGLLTIRDTAKVTVELPAGGYGTALSAYGGMTVSGTPTVELSGGAVGIASGNPSTSSGSAGDVTIGGGTVTVTCGDKGLNVNGNVNVSGGNTTVTAPSPIYFDNVAKANYGLLTVSDGVLDLTGTKAAVSWWDTNGNAPAGTAVPTPQISVRTTPTEINALGNLSVAGEYSFFTAAYTGKDETALAADLSNALKSMTFGAVPCASHTVVNDAAVAATCTGSGLTAGSHCSVCGTILAAQTLIDALGHDYAGIVTEPTCTEQGYTTYTCTRCDDSYVGDAVDALGHDYTGVVTAPTCTEQGYTTYTCTRCDDSYVGDAVYALGHDYTGVVTDPTCTEQGYTTYTCTRCDDSYVGDAVDALGHHYAYAADGTVITETCENDCGHSATAAISVPHDPYTYSGVARTPASVVTSGGWAGGALTPKYSGNTDAGTATASITVGGATASTTFTIAQADYTVTPSAASGTITVGAKDGPALTAPATGVNDEPVSGTLTKWYSDAACTHLISSFADYAVDEYPIYWKFVSDNANYIATPKTGSYTLTVAAGAAQSMTWAGAEGNLSTTYGTPITGKTASTNGDGGAITYSSSNTAVATVDSGTGALTIVGAGETVITAKAAAVPGKYRETQITYYLTVSKKDVTVTVTPVERKFGEGNPTFEAAVTAGGLADGDSIADLGLGLATASTAASGVGSYNVTGDGSYNTNYKVTINGTNALTVTKANAQNLTDIPVTQKYTLNTQQSRSVADRMPGDAGALTYARGTATGDVSEWAVSEAGLLTFTLNGSAGDIVTLPVIIGSTNYADSTVNVVVTLTDRDAPTVSAGDITVLYTGNAVSASAITGTATFDSKAVAGTWSWKDSAAVTFVADSGVKAVVFTPSDTGTYATVDTTLTLTINKATPTGAPKYTAISESGKTLTDAGLAVVGGTFSIAGSVKWVDAGGNALAAATTVTANTAYRWLFTPEDSENYNALSGSVTLYRVSTGGSAPATPVTPATSTVNGTTTAVVTVKPSTNGTSSAADVTADAVQAAVDAAVQTDAERAAVEILISTPAVATEVKVTLPVAAIKAVTDSETDSLTIQSGVGSVTMSREALASIARQAEGAVEITVSKVDPAKTLNERQRAAAGDAPVYDLSVQSDGNYISQFDGGLITVSLPYTLKPGEDPSGVVVWYLDENGNIEKVRAMYDAKTKTVIFTTNHFSLYVVGYDETAAWANPFDDVAETDYYYDAVRWAAANGMTDGTSATTFNPATSCTRAQAVTFLWRAAGSPVPAGSDCPFTDVAGDAYYYDAVLWALETGITDGTSATTFDPDAVCTRGQIVTFLWRSAGSPSVTTDSPFTDVAADSYYHAAVLWAAENGITNGTSATTFGPGETCVRGQIVTFLYRGISK